ncbi:collectin-12-like [Ruditapes philippinarum]|uniref:collectin-12-like n=1 Tax=Ruditapes philippinarum TaxID=129788 RepID=UPI00295B0A9D|nr:collectin-12-like [Ruditapes philippinarum]
MGFEIKKLSSFPVFSLILRLCLCEKLELFQTDGRISNVSESHGALSLLECSVIFERSTNSVSFNYNKETKHCELSTNFHEGFTIASTGWNVYSRIVNGGWSSWLSWGECSVTCKDGTRSRTRTCSNPSPSNGGQTCQDVAIENEACNERAYCFLATDYFLGSDVVTHSQAAAICDGMSARLVILESQEEIDFLGTLVEGFSHWIGMTCTQGENCKWIDGTSVDLGFTAWAPNEPQGRNCVWIGYYGNKWDDTVCYALNEFICEYL